MVVVHLVEREGRHVGEDGGLGAQILEIQMGERQVPVIALVGRRDDDERRGVGDGQRPEQQRVDEAEDGGVGANAQRQRQDGDQAEARAWTSIRNGAILGPAWQLSVFSSQLSAFSSQLRVTAGRLWLPAISPEWDHCELITYS